MSVGILLIFVAMSAANQLALQVNESEKARRYITALDDAKCQGRWQEIQELARKVNKHAPHRKCMFRHPNILPGLR